MVFDRDLIARRASSDNLVAHPDSGRIAHKSKSLDRHNNIQEYLHKQRHSQKQAKKGMTGVPILHAPCHEELIY